MDTFRVARMRVLSSVMAMMGRRSSQTEGHLPSRSGNITPPLNMLAMSLMAFIWGALHNLVAVTCCNLDYYVGDRPPIHIYDSSLQMISRCNAALLLTMDPSSPSPVSWRCCLAAGTTNERTSTGKRSCINYCLELGDNLHLSLSGSCMRASVLLNPCSTLSPVISPSLWHSSPVSVAKMPRLRQRMRCRRGSTRRQVRCSPSSSSSHSDTSSPSDSLPRLLRGRLIHSSRRLDSPSSSALPAQSHTALFSFDCSLNRPRVTAAILVVFLEEPQDEKVQNPSDRQGIQGNTEMDQALQNSVGQPSGSKDAVHGVTGHGPAEQTVSTPSRKVIHSVEDLYNERGELDEYWCRVEQVAPDE